MRCQTREGELRMQKAVTQNNIEFNPKKKKKITLATLKDQKYLIMMSFPFVIWVIIFNYLPLWGWLMAFQNYRPGKGTFEQKWVGLKHFQTLFTEPDFYRVMRNTLGMSFLGITFGFVVPIIFALLLNEVKAVRFKKSVQTISYLPHFVSWVIAASIVTTMLGNDGVVNELLVKIGILKEPMSFMTKPKLFWVIVTISDLWKETGWNAIIYLAAITGIDPEIYEAARVDGANRFKQMLHITLPGIRPTVMVLLILSIGSLVNTGFEKQWLLGNSLVQDYSLVLDKYIVDYGIGMFRYSYGTAIGIFKSIVSIILLFSANKIAQKMGEDKII
jgi:putative aldouronate transport system permease protein